MLSSFELLAPDFRTIWLQYTMVTISSILAKDGINWYYERQGSGPHLILIPSGEGDCGNFAKTATLLAASFTVTTFDMPGSKSHPTYSAY